MKNVVLVVLVIGFAVLANAQTTAPAAGAVQPLMTAESIDWQDPVVLFRGNVTITTDTLIVHADELDYNKTTSEGVVRGNVTVKLVPQAESSTSPAPDPPQ